MKTVRILSGGIGLRTETGVKLALRGSVLKVEDGEAAYLVETGSAEFIQEAPPAAPAEPDSMNETDTEVAEVTEEQLRRMKKADLIAIAAQKGIEVDESMKNADIVDLILAELDPEDEEEAPPAADPEMPE